MWWLGNNLLIGYDGYTSARFEPNLDPSLADHTFPVAARMMDHQPGVRQKRGTWYERAMQTRRGQLRAQQVVAD